MENGWRVAVCSSANAQLPFSFLRSSDLFWWRGPILTRHDTGASPRMGRIHSPDRLPLGLVHQWGGSWQCGPRSVSAAARPAGKGQGGAEVCPVTLTQSPRPGASRSALSAVHLTRFELSPISPCTEAHSDRPQRGSWPRQWTAHYQTRRERPIRLPRRQSGARQHIWNKLVFRLFLKSPRLCSSGRPMESANMAIL